MFLGTVEIAKAYLGTNLVFQKSGSNAPVYVDYIETDGTAYINKQMKTSSDAGTSDGKSAART